MGGGGIHMERTITINQLAEAINKIAQEHGEKTIYDVRRSISPEHSRLIILTSIAERVSVPLLEKDYIMENKYKEKE